MLKAGGHWHKTDWFGRARLAAYGSRLALYGHEMGLGSGKLVNVIWCCRRRIRLICESLQAVVHRARAYVAREKERKGVVVRFRFDDQRVRMAHNGDPVVNASGERIGWVTSCAVDAEAS